MNNANISGNANITIQEVSNSTITLNVNGEIREIQNQLTELKAVLKNLDVTNIKYENKIYNIGHINEANFGIVTSSKVFNGVLTKELILLLKEKLRPGAFLNNLPPEDKDNWETIRQHLKDAQNILEDSFIWVIGWEIRRLFSIGNDREKRMETKIDEYISHCFSTYRVTLQLAIYIFISKLWDEKSRDKDIDTNKKPIRNFFTSNRAFKLVELRDLLQALIDIFNKNQLAYPVEKTELGDIQEFLQPDSKFNKACIELEKLEAMDPAKEVYGLGHCHTAEISLTAILATFRLFTNYQLITLKKIEYEESRYCAARYIKELNILEKREAKNLMRILKYDKVPALTYSVFFRNETKAINLFPFLLDYNALTNETDFQIYFYECREGESDLRYFSIKNEKNEIISYMATASDSLEINSEEQKNELQKNIRLDLVARQFDEAAKTILGTSMNFRPKGSDNKVIDFKNL